MATGHIIKASIGDDMRRIALPSGCTFQILESRLRQTWNLRDIAWIKYLDEDGDLITIKSDEDFRQALMMTPLRVRVIMEDCPPPSCPPPPPPPALKVKIVEDASPRSACKPRCLRSAELKAVSEAPVQVFRGPNAAFCREICNFPHNRLRKSGPPRAMTNRVAILLATEKPAVRAASRK